MPGALGLILGMRHIGVIPAVVSISDQSTFHSFVGIAHAIYELHSNGIAYAYNSGVFHAIPGEWRLVGPSSAYDVRGTWTGIGGSVTGPTTYVNLGTTRTWYLFGEMGLTVSRTLLVEIVGAGTTTPVLDSATITFTAVSYYDGMPP